MATGGLGPGVYPQSVFLAQPAAACGSMFLRFYWENLSFEVELTSSPVFGSFVFIAGAFGTSLAFLFTRVGMETGSSLANEELKERFIDNHHSLYCLSSESLYEGLCNPCDVYRGVTTEVTNGPYA